MGSSNKIDITRFDPTNASDDQIRLWLFAIIQAELEKEDDEIDQELIDECSDCEAFLSHSNPVISQEEYALGLAKINVKAQAVQSEYLNVAAPTKHLKKHRFIRIAAYFLAATLAVAVLSVGIVAVANGSAAWEFITANIQQILGMNPGDTLEGDKVTLVKGDLVAEYDSVEEALKAGGFEGILYPTQLPDGVRIERIVHTSVGDSDNTKTSFILNSTNISYCVFNYERYSIDQYTPIETTIIQGTECYIVHNTEAGYYQAICYYNGFEYIYTDTNYNNLLITIKSFEELK